MLLALPAELFKHVLEYLDKKSIHALRNTSSELRKRVVIARRIPINLELVENTIKTFFSEYKFTEDAKYALSCAVSDFGVDLFVKVRGILEEESRYKGYKRVTAEKGNVEQAAARVYDLV